MGNDTARDYRFDIAVSFAGEDREYVSEIVEAVKGDMEVFYDADYQVEAWGKDGGEYFSDMYQNQARYVVMFISQHYAKKMWTRMERRAALARAAEQRSEYVLPIRLDDTQLEGLLSTVIYLDARRYGVDGLIAAIKQKVAGSTSAAASTSEFDGMVPRSQESIDALMTARPVAWEYLLYAGLLATKMENLEPKYRDFAIAYARRTGTHVPREALSKHVAQAISSIEAIVENFNVVLAPDTQQLAFGKPGEPGDVDRIVHLAERFISVYEDFMDWAAELRGASATGGGTEVLRLLARWVEQPVGVCRRFVREFVAEVDTFTERLGRGESVSVEMTLTLELDEATREEMSEKLLQVLAAR
jgi:hypothetical protein